MVEEVLDIVLNDLQSYSFTVEVGRIVLGIKMNYK